MISTNSFLYLKNIALSEISSSISSSTTTAATINSSSLPTLSSLSIIYSTFNRILFLRFISGLRNYILNVLKKPMIVDIIIHLSVSITFFGVLNRPDITPRLIVNMCKRFVGKGFLNSWTTSKQNIKDINNNDNNEISSISNEIHNTNLNESSSSSSSSSSSTSPTELDQQRSSPTESKKTGTTQDENIIIDSPIKVFTRSFNGLFMYNVIMHLAALGISNAIRKKSPPKIEAIQFALKEALILNVAVASSCTILVSTGFVVDKIFKFPKLLGSFISSLFVPLPLQGISNDSVKQSLFFLFVPWSIRFLSTYIDELISDRKYTSDEKSDFSSPNTSPSTTSSNEKMIETSNQKATFSEINEKIRLSLLYSTCLGLALATNNYSSNSWAVTILFSVAQRTISQAVRSFE